MERDTRGRVSTGVGSEGESQPETAGSWKQADHRHVPAAWLLGSRHGAGTEGNPALSPQLCCHKGEKPPARHPHGERQAWGPEAHSTVGCTTDPIAVPQGRRPSWHRSWNQPLQWASSLVQARGSSLPMPAACVRCHLPAPPLCSGTATSQRPLQLTPGTGTPGQAASLTGAQRVRAAGRFRPRAWRARRLQRLPGTSTARIVPGLGCQ